MVADKKRNFIELQTCSERRLQKMKNIIEKSKKFSKKDLNDLTKVDVATFLRNINSSELKQWTKNDYKKIFKAFLKSQYKNDYLLWLEDVKIKEGFKCVSANKAFNREKINKNTLLKPEELELLLRTAKSLKWKALLTLMYESAFRPCEIVNLRWKDLNFQDSKNICSVSTTSPKTSEHREIPVQDCIVHLKRWRDEYSFPNRTANDFVFPNPLNRNEHLSEAGVGVMLVRLCELAGMRKIFPYLMRHSRIYFIQKRLGARIASKYAGHSLEVSENYNHLDCDDVEEAMLQNVYTTKELSPEEENNLKLQMKKLVEETNAKVQMMEDWQQVILKYLPNLPKKDLATLQSFKPSE